MTTQNNALSGQSPRSSRWATRRTGEKARQHLVYSRPSSSSPGGVTYQPVKRSPGFAILRWGRKQRTLCRVELVGRREQSDEGSAPYRPTYDNVLTATLFLSRPAREFYHSSGWSAGRVAELVSRRIEVTVDLQTTAGNLFVEGVLALTATF